MSIRTLSIDDQLYTYLLNHTVQESDILKQLRQETAQHPQARMQISPEQGQFMALLVRLMGAQKTLEIGVFTGYSSLCVALALPISGQVIACDISDDFTQVARRYWKAAKVDPKIQLRLGPALKTLEQLLSEGQAETFDFAFIDADKANYMEYYEQSLKLLRPGGLIAIDNVLWSGRVADPEVTDHRTTAIRQLNDHVHQDLRVTSSLVPIGDGLLLALKH